MISAPWTEDQVKSLNAYQRCGYCHPFTYGDGPLQVDLIATTDGWVADAGGPVVQDWAHPFMADWSWRNAVLEVVMNADSGGVDPKV